MTTTGDRQRLDDAQRRRDSRALAKRPETVTDILLDQGRALTELKARWPNDLRDEIAARQFIAACLSVDLNPFLGEIAPMGGRPYVQLQGWEKLVQRDAQGQLAELEARPASLDEYRLWRVSEDDYFAFATCLRKFPDGTELRITRSANVTAAEASGAKLQPDKRGYAPVEKESMEMAMKRAKVRVLREAFADLLDVRRPQFGDVEVMEETPAPAQILEANRRTALEAARRAFNAHWREHGYTQGSVHRALALECRGRPHDIRDGYCTAAKERVQYLLKGKMVDSEAAGWELLRLAIESVGDAPAEPAAEAVIEEPPFEEPFE